MKINYSQILDEVADETGITLKDVKAVVNSFFRKVRGYLIKGFDVNILSFCKFKAQEVKERRAYSFKLKAVGPMPERLLPKCEFVREFKKQFK